MQKKEVIVTDSMFGLKDNNTIAVVKTPVKSIKSDAYKNAIDSIEKRIPSIPSIEETKYSYNKKPYFEYNRIKDISIDNNKVFNPDIFYEVGYKSITGFQFVKDSNLPELQNTYSQGQPLAFQGPETGTVFSYGPKINNLEFDSANYEYDSNGNLVALGSGNENRAKVYNNSLFNTSLKSSHQVFFNISTDASFFGFDYTNKAQKDLYNIETSNSNDLILKYQSKQHSDKKLGWDTFIKYSDHINSQPNIGLATKKRTINCEF